MLLFLDFDGVLHATSGAPKFNADSIAELESVMQQFSTLQIVITSSWREDKSIDELKALLGPLLGARVIGTTPIIDDPFLHYPRYHEVCTYLDTITEHNPTWIALDDEAGNYPPDAPVVLVDRRSGFTHADRVKLIAKILSINDESRPF